MMLMNGNAWISMSSCMCLPLTPALTCGLACLQCPSRHINFASPVGLLDMHTAAEAVCQELHQHVQNGMPRQQRRELEDLRMEARLKVSSLAGCPYFSSQGQALHMDNVGNTIMRMYDCSACDSYNYQHECACSSPPQLAYVAQHIYHLLLLTALSYAPSAISRQLRRWPLATRR